MGFLIEGVLTRTVKLKSPRNIPRFSALSFRSSLQLLILGLCIVVIVFSSRAVVAQLVEQLIRNQ